MNHQSIEVLLVEDDPTDAELTLRELKKNNLANHLFHVTDGEEAIEFIFGTGRYEDLRDIKIPPKIILLDIHLPKLNGIEVLSLIRSNEQTKSIPVIILTSSREDPDIQTCYKLGANSYIVKPVNFESFEKVVDALGYYWLVINQPPN